VHARTLARVSLESDDMVVMKRDLETILTIGKWCYRHGRNKNLPGRDYQPVESESIRRAVPCQACPLERQAALHIAIHHRTALGIHR
jgi:hypothetical protein